MRDGVRYDTNQSIVAQRTIFRWILTVKLESPFSKLLHSISSFMNALELNQQLTHFGELENVPNVMTMSPEENFCETLYKTTTFRDSSGRFVVLLPFKPCYLDSLFLDQSRNIAL